MDDDAAALHTVAINDEEQYAVWPAELPLPGGWREAGRRGTRAECLDYVEAVWTDLRPRSLRLAEDAP